MPPKGKKRIKRRSMRLARLNPNAKKTDKCLEPSTSNGSACTAHHSGSNDSDTDHSESRLSESSSPCLKQISNLNKSKEPSRTFFRHELSEGSQSDQADSDITEIVRFASPETSSNGVLDSIIPGTPGQSPNTDLLVSNIELVPLTSTSGPSLTLPQPQEDDPDTDDLEENAASNSRVISLSSQSNSGNSRTISLRSHRRRHHAQSRAIMSAYRSFPSSLPVKGESFCDCPKTSRDLTCSCGEEDTVFEWRWDPIGKSAACDLSDEDRTAIFHVSYSSGTAAVKGSLPMNDRQYFWEVKMTSPVYGTDMMVGIGTANLNLDSFRHTFTSLLGRDGDSWGLSYYGRFQQKGQFRPVAGAKFGQGSIIGLHVDMWRGTLSYYKNRKPLGILCSGLHGKTVYPMVSSTAARTTMKIIKSCSFQTSLQFLCCQALRKMVPEDMDVTDVVGLPPGLRAFLANNLSWLLRPNELHSDFRMRSKKRRREEHEAPYETSSEEEGAPPKRFRFGTREDISEASDLEEEMPVDLALPQT